MPENTHAIDQQHKSLRQCFLNRTKDELVHIITSITAMMGRAMPQILQIQQTVTSTVAVIHILCLDLL